MSFFKRLFGGKKAGSTSPAPAPPVIPTDPAKDPNMIRVFDGYGREFFITREKWRTEVLPGTIQSNWNNPDDLYSVILSALNDGFRAEIIPAAKHLYKTDHNSVRGACIWGIVLKEEGRLGEAEGVFRSYMAKHGEDGIILTNLAKVYAQRRQNDEAERMLWHALELDPNQDNGVGWYWSIHKERGGDAAGDESLKRVAALPKSWRAQAWLGRSALERRDLEAALTLYKEVLGRIEKPAPGDLLMQISGDLGNFGHLPEILQLVEPLFQVEIHGMQVGNNLIKAHLDLGQIDSARKILDRLYALNRVDWKQTLSFWDTEIAKARVTTVAPVDETGPLKIGLLGFEGPIWLKPSSPATELFPAKATPDRVTVCFLGCSAEADRDPQQIEHQLADKRGRLSRAVPLFLAEQVEFGTDAQVRTMVPWIAHETGGFVLSAGPWTDSDASQHAGQGDRRSDYVIVTHIKSAVEPWIVELRLIRTIDSKRLAECSVEFQSDAPEQGLPILAEKVLKLLSEYAEVAAAPFPAVYQVPQGMQFGYYLLRLEQLLAVRCAGMEGVNRGFLSGEREIVDGNILLCAEFPDNVCTRILLAQTLLAMKRARPDIIGEFQPRVEQLQKEMPLQGSAHGVVQRLLEEAFAQPS